MDWTIVNIVEHKEALFVPVQVLDDFFTEKRNAESQPKPEKGPEEKELSFNRPLPKLPQRSVGLGALIERFGKRVSRRKPRSKSLSATAS